MKLQAHIDKPLQMKAYGHIPHLPGSKNGPGDHTCNPGLAKMMTEKLKSKNDFLTVSAKADGCCVSVARQRYGLLVLGKSGYLASASPYEQHQLFATWVNIHYNRFMNVLKDGERIVGEWLLQAHGTKYVLMDEPFLAFDIMKGHDRLPYNLFRKRIDDYFLYPCPLFIGHSSCSIETAMNALGEFGKHGELELAEGAVWRLERKVKGKTIIELAKFVRQDKVAGKYLKQEEPVWNMQPKNFLTKYCGVRS